MDKLYLIIAIEVIIIILIEMIISYFVKLNFSYRKEKRIASYSIQTKPKYNLPLFSLLEKQFVKLIKFFSKILLKSSILRNYSKKFVKYLEINNNEKSEPIDFISFKLTCACFIWLLYLITSLIRFKFNFALSILIFFLTFFLPDIFLAINYRKNKKTLEKDLLEAVIVMNNAFKSGKNILEAIEIVKEEIDEPLKSEFKKIYIDLTHGLDIDVVFKRFYERIKIEDIKYITSSLTLLNKTGGNIVKVFSSIETNFYDKLVLNQELETLTSSSKLMYRMLLIMPFILITIIMFLNKSYFEPLFSNILGYVILLISLILYIIYALIIRKVIKVKL